MKCCINGGNFIRLLQVSIELFKFEIQKCGQILCVHKPYFLMPGHIYFNSKSREKRLITKERIATYYTHLNFVLNQLFTSAH